LPLPKIGSEIEVILKAAKGKLGQVTHRANAKAERHEPNAITPDMSPPGMAL